MPTYEYQCASCGLKFEQKQSMTDPPLTECPLRLASARLNKVEKPAVVETHDAINPLVNKPHE